jgi:hypothetical protein
MICVNCKSTLIASSVSYYRNTTSKYLASVESKKIVPFCMGNIYTYKKIFLYI